MDYDIVIENKRDLFATQDISMVKFRAKARDFVEQEILGGRRKERIY